MSFPYGADYEGTDYGVSKGASIPGMAGRTEDAVTEQLKAGVGDGHWGGLGGGLIAMILSFIAGAITAILGGFATVIDAILGTVNNDFVAAMPIINDHSESITDLQEAIEQLILQGAAIKFVSNNTYTPAVGVVSVDVILIGAGAGGSSGSYDALNSGTRSGGGGGGGGETHVNVPASLLPVDGGGNFLPIQIVVGAGGDGAAGDQGVGQGGGHTYFGPEVGSAAQPWLMAGGGTGGSWGNIPPVSPGGIGMIPGGDGGPGGGPGGAPGAGEHSTSAFDLHGGGGGGGGGYAQAYGGAGSGGGGGISPGGSPGNPGQPPSTIVATGGGGGGGGPSGNLGGADGAYPAGGGGGSACSIAGATTGGDGGDGVVYVIERMA
ncbi:hypothetical protein [Nocardia fusca]|uniref:Glycine-rich domain-containing protein n=1 Tax=Nocardia fusca TaxID=941183 RepID=A0ABV3FIF5_9NOCA